MIKSHDMTEESGQTLSHKPTEGPNTTNLKLLPKNQNYPDGNKLQFVPESNRKPEVVHTHLKNRRRGLLCF